jgi:hypothetical protein
VTYYNGSSWSSPVQISSDWSSTPPVFAQQGGYMNIFFAGQNGQIKAYWSNNPGSWSGVSTISGSNTITPFAVIVDNGVFNVIYSRSGDNKIMRQYSGNGWSSPVQVGNNFAPLGVSALLDNGYQNVFWRDANSYIRSVYTNNGVWSSPAIDLGIKISSHPKVVNYFGALKLFGVEVTDSKIWYQNFQNGWQSEIKFSNDITKITPEVITFEQ